MTFIVSPTPVPAASLIVGTLERVDYQDAFRVALPRPDITVDDAVRATLGAMPGWIGALLRLRDAVVKPFGLKRGADMPSPVIPERFAVGDAVSLFRVDARSEREIVFGQEDTHLDFRASLLVEPSGELVFSTLVQLNGPLGRAYFIPVGPAHRRIVPAMMRAACAALASEHARRDQHVAATAP
jgi:Protein of unknown function (DUF2867)